MGEEGDAPGGVFGHGAQEEDGPVTWETLVFPWRPTGGTESR